ncbi:unnamed protein product [Trichobilharzia szidati]|nr:unnamed protein product [Trichobilharzia szidati]
MLLSYKQNRNIEFKIELLLDFNRRSCFPKFFKKPFTSILTVPHAFFVNSTVHLFNQCTKYLKIPMTECKDFISVSYFQLCMKLDIDNICHVETNSCLNIQYTFYFTRCL